VIPRDDRKAAVEQPFTPLAEPDLDVARPRLCVPAVASFVCSFFGLPGAVVSVVLAVIALRRIERQGLRGKAFAWAGMALSALWLILLVGMLVAYEAASGSVVSGHL
jgi:hypothetical protein